MNTKKLVTFILCAFIPMIGLGVVMHSIGAASADSSLDPATVNPLSAIIGALLSSVAMLLPMLAVIITQLINKEPVFKNLDINFKVNRWWVMGWLLMPVLALAVLGITLLMPGAVWSPDSEVVKTTLAAMPEGLGLGGLIVITLISGLFAGLTINAVFAFGEEIGWRGYLLKIFKGKSFLTTALWTGIIWGLWHAPLILNGHNYPQHPVAGVFMMVGMCLFLTPMLIYFRLKSRSVIVPAIMHGTFNAVVGLSMILVTPANDLLYGGPGLAGLISLLLFDICIFLYDRFISKENIFTSLI